MSHLAKILSIITVVLTLFPCSDGYAQFQENNIEISLNTNDTQDHHSDDGDLCTPFCTCVCCASLVYFQKSLDISQIEPIGQMANNYFASNLTSGFTGRNFQPPKL